MGAVVTPERRPPNDTGRTMAQKHLVTVRSNASLALMTWGALRSPRALEVLRMNDVIVRAGAVHALPAGVDLPMPPDEPIYSMGLARVGEMDLRRAANEFLKASLRNFTNDSFEIVTTAGKSADAYERLRAEPWFHVARLVRGALTHDQLWKLADDKRHFVSGPLTWGSITIDPARDGQMVTFSEFDWFKAIQLWEALYDFADSLP